MKDGLIHIVSFDGGVNLSVCGYSGGVWVGVARCSERCPSHKHIIHGHNGVECTKMNE